MDFRTAQALDRWLGIPACFFLSLYDTLRAFFFRGKITGGPDPEKILFIGLSEIGSNVLAFGAVAAVRDMFPKAELYFLTFEENQEVLEVLGVAEANNVFTLRNGGLWALFSDTMRFVRAARRERIDTVVDLELFSRFSAILACMSGARVRSGFDGFGVKGLYRGDLLTHRVQFNQQRHISENFLALVRSLKESPSERPLLKEPLPRERAAPLRHVTDPSAATRVREKLRSAGASIPPGEKIVILNLETGTRLPLRSWPLQNYKALAEKLQALPDVWVVVIGRKKTGSSFPERDWRCVDLTGRTSIKELVDLFRISRVLVSHDSGAVHLASLTDIEKVVLFGPETPLLYGPLSGRSRIITRNLFCSPCLSSYNHRSSPCRENRCMTAISVEEVFQAVRDLLERTFAGGNG